MSVLAAVRTESWSVPLFLHVLGAMILIGGLAASTGCLALARGDARLLRFGYWSLLAVSLPGWVLLRAGAAWVYSREGRDDLPAGYDQPAWLDLGRTVADGGGLILLIAIVLGGIGVHRQREAKGTGLLKVTLALSTVLLAADVIAVWAMAGKPG
jgi:hypothetical protein